MRETVLYFVKYPEIGKVKTRLAKSIGFEDATAYYDELATLNFNVLKTWQSKSADRQLWVYYDAHATRVQIENWLPGASSYLPQDPRDLGVRLVEAFKACFADGMVKGIALGSDTIGFDERFCENAFELISDNSVVLGPAKDGGYYCIGLNQFQPHIFDGVGWSSPDVLEDTLKNINQFNLNVSLLRELEDLDEEENLKAFKAWTSSVIPDLIRDPN